MGWLQKNWGSYYYEHFGVLQGLEGMDISECQIWLLESILDDVEREEDVGKADCEVPIENPLSSICTSFSSAKISTNYKTLGSPINYGVENRLELLFSKLCAIPLANSGNWNGFF